MQPPTDPIPLAPIPTPPAPDPEPMLRTLRPLDGLLVLALLAFAFMVASFRANNSDVWLHLATRRLIAQGQYPFGADPFTFTATGWVNHAWLYCLVLFNAYGAFGAEGAALVVIKALIVVIAALVMFVGGKRPGERAWIPVMCAALGVLAMSPRLLLTPLVVTVFGSAYTWLLLARQELGWRRLWVLPVICVLWVNCDAWFFLGPVIILLYAAGEALQGGKEAKLLALVGVVSLAACVFNPYHVMAFTALPPELLRVGAAAELTKDPLFRSWHTTVFEPDHYQLHTGLSVAGMSFFVLIAVGLTSFGLTFPKVSFGRALLFVALLGLALFAVRTVPQFAAVAAPIAALNFLDAADRRFGSQAFARREWKSWAVGGRALSLLLLIVAGVASYGGWLQSTPHINRRFGFGVDTEAGLKAVAESAVDLGGSDPHWVNLSPEAVAYYAWFAPGSKLFLDHRLGLYSEDTVREFLAVRRSLQGEDRPDRAADAPPPEPAWRAVMRGRKPVGVVFHSNSLDATRPTLHRLLGAPGEWTPVAMNGRSSAYLWSEPGPVSPQKAKAALDFDALAFGPDARPVPDVTPPPLTFLDALTGEVRPTPNAAFTAQQHLIRYEIVSGIMQQDNVRVFLGLLGASTVGSGGGGLTAMSHFLGVNTFSNGILGALDAGPPASAYLALRSAREAIGLNPQDWRGPFALARSAEALARDSRERSRTQTSLPQAGMIRTGQVMWAGRQVLAAEAPAYIQQVTHMTLMQALDERMRAMQAGWFVDQQHEHRAAVIRLAHRTRVLPQTNVPLQEMGKVVEAQEKDLRARERDLQKRRDDYEVQSARLPAVARAGKALERGLSAEAIKVLTAAPPKEMAANGGQGYQLLIELWLTLGRVAEVQDLLTSDPKAVNPAVLGTHALGVPAFEWYRAQIAATVGDYDAADDALASIGRQALTSPMVYRLMADVDVLPEKATGPESPSNLGRMMALVVGDLLLREARRATRLPGDILNRSPLTAHSPPRWRPVDAPFALNSAVQYATAAMDQAATATALRAWLALERGDTAAARKLAQQAIDATDLGEAPGGARVRLSLRSAPLAALVRQLTRTP